MNYFTQKDINMFADHANKAYDANDPDDKLGGYMIRTKVFDKVSHWGKLLAQELEYDCLPNNNWLKPYRSQFRDYAWCRIFPDSSNHQLFFNVEANAEERELVIKMDCKFSGSDSLDNDRVTLFRNYIDDRYYMGQCVRWFIIKVDEYDNFDDLVKFSIQFIRENMDRFNEIRSRLESDDLKTEIEITKLERANLEEFSLTQIEFTPEISSDQIMKERKVPYEKQGEEYIPVDYISRNIENKRLGDLGEKLIMKVEQRKINLLIKKGVLEKGTKVLKRPDKVGYDLLSFDENGEEIHIEVKTTTRKKEAPFYMSHNEHLVMHKDPKWRLFRVHDLNKSNGQGSYFIWDKELTNLYVQFFTKSYYCKMK